jgi:hypothetical protein
VALWGKSKDAAPVANAWSLWENAPLNVAVDAEVPTTLLLEHRAAVLRGCKEAIKAPAVEQADLSDQVDREVQGGLIGQSGCSVCFGLWIPTVMADSNRMKSQSIAAIL